MKKLIAILLFAAVAIVSCQKGPEELPGTSISGFEDMSFSYDGSETCSFSIVSGYSWSLDVGDNDWIQLSQSAGRASVESIVRVSAKANDDIKRSGKLTLYAGETKKTITVSQKGFPIVPELKILELEEGALDFLYTDTEPVSFKVWSNVDWTISKDGLDWLKISPMTGPRKAETIVTVKPSLNSNPARNGKMTFSAEEMTPVVLAASQTAYDDTPMLKILDMTETSHVFLAMSADPLIFTLRSNRAWTIDKQGADWLSVSESSHSANDFCDTAISIIASDNNTAASRQCQLSISSEAGSIILDITQISLSSDFSAVWTLDASVVSRNADWEATGTAYDDSRNAWFKWNSVADAAFYGGAVTYSYTKSNNTYMWKSIWEGDYLEFTVPVDYVEAGTGVSVAFKMKTNSAAPRFWFLEYLDGEEWKKTSTKEGTAYNSTDTVECTAYFSNGNDMTINESFTIRETLVKGQIKLRLTCADGTHCAKSVTILAKSNKDAGVYFTTGNSIKIENIK